MTAPRNATLAVALGCALAGAVIAAIISSSMGGDRPAIVLAATTVLVSSVPNFLTGFFSGTVELARWGMAAFFGILSQPLIAAAVGLVFDKTRELAREPFWVGCLVGALVILISQVSWAVSVLGRAQRTWETSRKVTEAV